MTLLFDSVKMDVVGEILTTSIQERDGVILWYNHVKSHNPLQTSASRGKPRPTKC